DETKTKTKEEGRKKSASSKKSSSPTLNPDRFFNTVKNSYQEIGNTVRAEGTNPGDMPAEAWEPANKIFEELKNLSEEYKTASTPLEKRKIESRMRGLRQEMGGSVRGGIKYAAQKYREEHGPAVQNVEVQPPQAPVAEPVPQESSWVEELKAQMQEETAGEIKDMAAARAAATAPSGASTDAPTIKITAEDPVISPEAKKLEDEEQREIDERIAAAHTATGGTKVEDNDFTAAEAKDEIRRMAAEATAAIGIPAPTEPDGRTEPIFGTEPVEPEDIPPQMEGTPKEWRDKLRGLIEGAKEKITWWKSAEEGLIRRKTELDAEGEKVPGIEKLFRFVGEKYNEMPFKYKVALGASLGVGTALTAGTLAMALPLLGIAAQRGAGLATMYMKFEKNSHEEKWGKEKAMAKAGLYTVLLGLTMKEAIEYLSQTDIAHAAQAKVEGWLGAMLGHEAAAPEAPVQGKAPEAAAASQTAAPEVASTAQPTTPPAAAPEAPPAAPVEAPKAPEVAAQEIAKPEAAPETAPVAKPLAAAAPEVHEPATPSDAPKAPEAPQPAAAPAETPKVPEPVAPEVAEPIAVPPEVAKLEADEGIVITEIQVPTPEPVEPFVAPTETAETLAAHAEAPTAPGVTAEAAAPEAQSVSTEPAAAPAEAAPVSPVSEPLPSETIVTPPSEVPELDLTHEQDLAQARIDAADATVVEQPPVPEVPAAPSEVPPATEAQPLTPETISTPDQTVQAVDITNAPERVTVQNQFGITVHAGEAHLYEGAGGKGVFVFGGTAQEKAGMMREFFKENPTKIIYSADETGTKRVPWRFIQGQIVRGDPEKQGWQLFGKTFMKAPTSDDLAKIIK
ncbi:MAG: hypothetical protein WC217_01950, partial [Candidatus Paceibacterota bacterium]